MGAIFDITAPLEQEGTRSVVRRWLKRVGEPVAANEPIVEIETDKVAVEVASESSGVLAEILIDAGAEAEPGALLGRLSEGGEAAAAAAKPKAAASAEAAAPAAQDWATDHPRISIASFDPALRLSPSVRRLLVETGLDPKGLAGSGKGGRLTRQDVEAALTRRRPSAPRAEPRPTAASGGTSTIPHDNMRLSIAEHMTRSLATAPHVTAVFEADFSAIAAHRAAHKAEFERRGVGLTYTAYLAFAAAQAMQAAPQVNSRWFDDRLEVYEDVDLGVGVSLGERGLIVPVVRKVQTLTLFEIAERLQTLTEKARVGKLAPADVRGGTFSISNHGVTGSLVAAPVIINQPQSAILGVGKMEKRVVVREVGGADAIQIRPMAYVSLTIDHRAIDGHQTNAWLTRFTHTLEGWR